MVKDVEIILTIGPGGTVEMEGVNYEGQACDKDMRALMDALGVVHSVEKKPEYFAKAKVDVKIRQSGGR